jgi:CBS domain-containing protein
VYTIQQAYLAMSAGATYVCPLVGRLQDQGQDALGLVAQCVDAVNYYGYNTKVMFSSVRNVEHVRNALNMGVHTITVPWKIMKGLADNHFTAIGTQEFIDHTRLMTKRVNDVLGDKNPTAHVGESISNCLLTMTAGGFGAVTIVDDHGHAVGIFTDGDLRRLMSSKGGDVSNIKLSDLPLSPPKSVEANELLEVASNLFKSHQIDTLVVTHQGKVAGMLDIQDLVSDSL